MTQDLDKLYSRYASSPDNEAYLGALLEQVSAYGAQCARAYARKSNREYVHQDPEDFGQDAMLHVWRGLGKYDPARGSFKAWLGTVTFNLLHTGANLLEAKLTDMPDQMPEPDDTAPDVTHIDLSKYTPKERAILYWSATDQDFELTGKRFGWTSQDLRRRLHRIKVKYNPAA